jgi:hypothetical protein
MDQKERQVIDDLFGKLSQAHERSGTRDAEAERLIRTHIERQPAAPYYMSQAILVQEQALVTAQERIRQLESELAQRPAAGGGGFLSGLFGGGAQNIPAARPAAGGPLQGIRPGGSGFLGGALQTAMGVVGGVLIGNMLMDAFSADPAAAAQDFVEDTAGDLLPEEAGWDEEI